MKNFLPAALIILFAAGFAGAETQDE